MWSLLSALEFDCRWAVLRDWDSGRWAQRLLYIHSAVQMLGFLVCDGILDALTMSVEYVEGVDGHGDDGQLV